MREKAGGKRGRLGGDWVLESKGARAKECVCVEESAQERKKERTRKKSREREREKERESKRHNDTA